MLFKDCPCWEKFRRPFLSCRLLPRVTIPRIQVSFPYSSTITDIFLTVLQSQTYSLQFYSYRHIPYSSTVTNIFLTVLQLQTCKIFKLVFLTVLQLETYKIFKLVFLTVLQLQTYKILKFFFLTVLQLQTYSLQFYSYRHTKYSS